jgi:hypothetical protein
MCYNDYSKDKRYGTKTEEIKMKKYYAEKATWGQDTTTIIVFDTKVERDEYVAKTDYANSITAKEVAARKPYYIPTLAEYEAQFNPFEN